MRSYFGADLVLHRKIFKFSKCCEYRLTEVGKFGIVTKYSFGYADMAELADAPDLGSGVPDVQVQVLSPAD